MTVISKKILKNISSGGGELKIRLTLPCFNDGGAVGEKLSELILKIADAIEASAVSGGFNAVSEFFVPCCTDSVISIAVDLFCYKNNALIDCLRLSSTRDRDGFEVIPPKKLSKKIPKNGGWYFDGKTAVIYQNNFISGDETGLRRSEYRRLFHEVKTDITLDLQRTCFFC